MNIYEMKKKLAESKKAVFSINEISRIFSMKKKIVSVYLNRMLKKKLVFKIERGKVSISKDPFIIASQLITPSYISLVSALYLHGSVSQVVDRIFVVSSKKRNSCILFNTNIQFLNAGPKMMFGYKKIDKENSFIFIADLEKVIIDCLSFQRYSRISYLLKALAKADINKLEEYAERLNKEVINRKLGYLLDLVGRKHRFKRKTKTSYKLNSAIKRKGKFNKKWYLYLNEEIKCY